MSNRLIARAIMARRARFPYHVLVRWVQTVRERDPTLPLRAPDEGAPGQIWTTWVRARSKTNHHRAYGFLTARARDEFIANHPNITFEILK